MTNLNLEVKGADKVVAALNTMTREIKVMMVGMSREIRSEILETQGLQNYPGQTDANLPPTPYYIRGSGMQYKSGNNGKSENLKQQWSTKTIGGLAFSIENRASYAPYVHGDDNQAHWMKAIGWRKLGEVAIEKTETIRKIAEAFIQRLIARVGL